jgi:hypothetical protein
MRRSHPVAVAVLLLALAGCSSDDNVLAPLPSGNGSLEVVQASPDAPLFDVLVDNISVITRLPFSGASNYMSVRAGTRDVKFNQAGTTTTTLGTMVGLESDQFYTLFVTDTVTAIGSLLIHDLLPAASDDSAYIRFVNLVPDAPAVDLTTSDGTVLFSNVPFKGYSGFRGLVSLSGQLQVRLAGTSTVLFDSDLVGFAPLFNYTVWFKGKTFGTGNQALDLAVLTHD